MRRLIALSAAATFLALAPGPSLSKTDKEKRSPKPTPIQTPAPRQPVLAGISSCADEARIDDVISRMTAKTDFQTAQQYDGLAAMHLMSVFGPGIVIERTCSLNDKFRYDAEKQTIVTYPYQYSTVYSNQETRPDYSSTNSFGAAVLVHASYTKRYVISWPQDLRLNFDISTPMTSEIAQREFDNIGLAMTGRAIAPYAYHQHKLGHPTYAFPWDDETDEYGISMVPKMFYVYNKKTGDIYGTSEVILCN